ncbi:ABC transporter permease [Desulfitobacterium sp. AusDCA]|uniref:ABC transporter permease n=1 Tax=Desulfitobacterium sp. AusDCA TaxID=3240383 RepID=UPI003DA78CA2
MITVRRLFLRRIVSEWKYQYQVWKTAVDWIVALYIVIPFLLIFLNTYLSWWRTIPEWVNYLSLNALLGIILFFVWSGSIRIFVEEADQLFVYQQRDWIKKLIKLSLVYFLGFNLLETLLFSLILAPFLILYYGFSPAELLELSIFVFGLKASIDISKQLIERRFQGWNQTFIKMAVVIVSGIYLRLSVFLLTGLNNLFFCSAALLFLALIILAYMRITISGVFYEDVISGQASKLKMVNLLLRQAGTAAKRTKNRRQRPWMFRNSNPIYRKRTPENVLIELCIKSTIRNGEDIKFYFEVVAMCLLMLTAFPKDWKWFLWFMFIVFLTNMIRLFWQKFLNSAFVKLFPLISETQMSAASRTLFLMALPGQILIGLVTAIQTQEWLISLLMFPIGLIIARLAAKKLVFFT